jgi:hypothetical protein
VRRALGFLGVAMGAALVAPACAAESNAYLELEVRFPGNDTGTTRHAVVGVVSGDVSFDEDWRSTEPLPSTTLSETKTTTLRASVEGRAEIEADPVRVKVRFCRDPSCAAVGDDNAPEVRFQIERAFYLGERTSATIGVDCIPYVLGETDGQIGNCATKNRSLVTVAKCAVAGCREGVTTNYCAGGKHFCEK